MIMLDLQKTFDIVSFFAKHIEEIDVVSTEWFKSYLSGRQLVVTIDGNTYCLGLVTWSFPKGYTLAFAFSLLREWYGHQCLYWL